MLYRYRLCNADGSEAGEAHYAVLIQPGETIHAGDGRKLLVLEVVPTEDEADEYVWLLRRSLRASTALCRARSDGSTISSLSSAGGFRDEEAAEVTVREVTLTEAQ